MTDWFGFANEPPPPIPCPYCKAPCTCWTDHIGTMQRLMQTGPYHCEACGAVQSGTWDSREEFEADGDPKTGWYPHPTEVPRG